MSKSEKEKKKKLSLRRNIDNNLFALAQVWGTSKSYFIIYYLMTFLNAPLEFLLYTYLIRLIVDSVEGVG